MAVGRRKRFGGGQLAASAATLVTAGAAPGDGSAAATVWVTIANTTGSAQQAILLLSGNYVLNYGLAIPGTASTTSQVTAGPFDLMGGETLSGYAPGAAGAGVYWSAYGVEAKDS